MNEKTGNDGRNWLRLRTDVALRSTLQLRHRILQSIRSFFDAEGFVEIDVPCLVPLPGMEPHLHPFSTYVRTQNGERYRFYLHTSPEYAMKKLLAAGFERIYALTHAFRNAEISKTHNPEFTILEWYRAGADYNALMVDCERLLQQIARDLRLGASVRYQGRTLDLTPPWPRLSVREAMRQYAGVEVGGETSLDQLLAIAHEKGYGQPDRGWPWEDVFFLIFLNEVEPNFPLDRPLFLIDYPVQMAALARAKRSDPLTAERFELYIGGLELANAFSELTDPAEQRRRLQYEREERARLGREVYPIDESFLEALARGMPESAGIALGVDRLVMLLADAEDICEILAFPMKDLIREWRRSHGKPVGVVDDS